MLALVVLPLIAVTLATNHSATSNSTSSSLHVSSSKEKVFLELQYGIDKDGMIFTDEFPAKYRLYRWDDDKPMGDEEQKFQKFDANEFLEYRGRRGITKKKRGKYRPFPNYEQLEREFSGLPPLNNSELIEEEQPVAPTEENNESEEKLVGPRFEFTFEARHEPPEDDEPPMSDIEEMEMLAKKVPELLKLHENDHVPIFVSYLPHFKGEALPEELGRFLKWPKTADDFPSATTYVPEAQEQIWDMRDV